jgi:TldD protein
VGVSELIQIATDVLLSPAELTAQQMVSSLNGPLVKQADLAEIFLQRQVTESWVCEDGILRDADYSVEQGFGLRIAIEDKVGFAYADTIELPVLKQAADSAAAILRGGKIGTQALLARHKPTALYSSKNPLDSLSDAEKVALLLRVDAKVRAKDARVENVIVRLSASHEVVLILQHDGSIQADVRPMVSFNLTVVIKHQGHYEKASAGGGVRDGYAFFTEAVLDGYIDKVLRQVNINIEAQPAPAGLMPVVLGSGWAAVILHEAIGHGLEGDFNRRGSSAFSGRLGERVASAQCTIVDDGTLVGRRGSLTIDDEGVAAQCTTLIEEGRLVGYMQDRQNARLMGVSPTGNGRRETYAHQPIPRMTNTYMLAGNYVPEEIIQSVERGIYAVDFSGGQVDITSGKFVFTTSEAYLIENGKIKHPIKPVTLIGNGPDVLTKVSMVGNDLALDPGIGMCGKDGQSVPVGVGQPTLKIDELVVGGAA